MSDTDQPDQSRMAEGGGPEGGLDAANRALADALRVSFTGLKWIIVALAILFLASGVYEVGENEVAVQVRFGEVVKGEKGRDYVEEGWHWAWPEPVDQVIRVPTTEREVFLGRAFWPQVGKGVRRLSVKQQADSPQVRGPLVPGQDGSLITGDRKLVHAQVTATYQVRPEDAVAFVRNVGDMARADRLVRHAVEKAMVEAAAAVTAETFLRTGVNSRQFQSRIQRNLAGESGTGLTITGATINKSALPFPVRSAVKEMRQEQRRNQDQGRVVSAKQKRSEILNSTAGGAYRAMNLVIDYYEDAKRVGDTERVKKGERVLNRLLDQQPAAEALKPLVGDPKVDDSRLARARTPATVGGQVSEIISRAETYQTEVEEKVKNRAQKFRELQTDYQKNPSLVVRHRREQLLKRLLSDGNAETFYLPSDQSKNVQLRIGRDPRIQRKQEQKKYLQQLEENRQKAKEMRKRFRRRQRQRQGAPSP